ncbi:hypothetical protein HID58_080851 [Brassica napus]|uniref:Peptidase M24 domain-containing protein n=1 Tax=Brassica napus TaxID=3708 RepID=A0ABQ7Y979_BRANA|nr:hypothetical protein HID58_080851 [Brassica napus]
MAFNPVVGGGSNASVIHYSRNDQRIKDGDLVLLTWAVSYMVMLVILLGHGHLRKIQFSSGFIYQETHSSSSFLIEDKNIDDTCGFLQEELYDLILETTNKESIKLCKPGTTIRQLNTYSTDMLCDGLMKMGILKNRHYLGMDVHDSSSVGYDRPLVPGSVITIEPGVYIPSSFNCSEGITLLSSNSLCNNFIFQGIGIRIEDEVLITETATRC